VALDAIRSLWLGAPAGEDAWATAVWSLALVALFAPPLAAGYWRSAGR
jgi:hypothetical protein